MDLFSRNCPCCDSAKVDVRTRYTTQNNGTPPIYYCRSCAIKTLFNGKINQLFNHNPAVFGEICKLFDQTFDRLSDDEITVLEALAMQNQHISFSGLQSFLVHCG